MTTWWEETSLRFKCKSDCFNCCEKPGYVFMDSEDVDRASGFLKITRETFQTSYLTPVNDIGVIEVTSSRPCPFLDSRGCRIHSAKPKQCQTYPFWPENLQSVSLWEKTAEDCPGIGSGPQISSSQIKTFLTDG